MINNNFISLHMNKIDNKWIIFKSYIHKSSWKDCVATGSKNRELKNTTVYFNSILDGIKLII